VPYSPTSALQGPLVTPLGGITRAVISGGGDRSLTQFAELTAVVGEGAVGVGVVPEYERASATTR
jgi:hypothetical protein